MSNRLRCQATTAAGNPCKNWALEGESFCRVHLKVQVAAPVPDPIPTAEPEAQVAEENGGRFQQVVDHLNQLAAKLHEQTPSFVPPPFSPNELLRLVRENVDRFTPEAVTQLRGMLEGATAEDFKDPETWKGMWFILTYTAKEESKSLLNKATSTIAGLPGVSHGLGLLSQMPGAGLVSDISGMLEGASPSDFLDKETWAGMWFILNHSLQHEASEMKRRICGEEDRE